MARPKGSPKLGGRQKGTLNKINREAKDALAAVFDRLGGEDALYKWAMSHLDIYYTQIWPKLLPLQVNGSHNVNLNDDERTRDAEERADRAIAALAILGGTAALQDEPGLSAGIRAASDRLQ